MIEWMFANKEWVFSGVGVAIVIGLFAFLRRSSPTVSTEPRVIVHVQQTVAATATGAAPPATSGSLTSIQASEQLHSSTAPSAIEVKAAGSVPIERITPLTAKEIHSAIQETPPLHRDSVGKRYEGLRVEWETAMLNARDDGGGMVRLLLNTTDATSCVRCKVNLADYKELGVMPQGALIRVSGTIVKVEFGWVDLSDVRLSYLESHPADT